MIALKHIHHGVPSKGTLSENECKISCSSDDDITKWDDVDSDWQHLASAIASVRRPFPGEESAHTAN
jgi:hypothetical protein